MNLFYTVAMLGHKGQTFYFVQLIVVFEYINYRVVVKNLMSLTKMVAT